METLLALAGVVFYFGVRGVTEGRFDVARENAERVIAIERLFGLFREAELQRELASGDTMIALVNWVYIWGHWPAIFVVAFWLVLTQPSHYRLIRNGFVISGAIGLVIFVAFPVAPPRLLDLGIADTVTDRSQAYRWLQPPGFVNQYAAMPSLHFGWDLLIGVALCAYGGHVVLRALGFLLPAAMFAAVVLTGNHFILDAVAGGALALVGLAGALVLSTGVRRSRQDTAGVP